MNHHSGVRKDQRVSGACIQFASNHLFYVPKGFLKCSEDLRGAAKGVRVLNFCTGIHRLGKRAPLVVIDATGIIGMGPKRVSDTPCREGWARKPPGLTPRPTEPPRPPFQQLKKKSR